MFLSDSLPTTIYDTSNNQRGILFRSKRMWRGLPRLKRYSVMAIVCLFFLGLVYVLSDMHSKQSADANSVSLQQHNEGRWFYNQNLKIVPKDSRNSQQFLQQHDSVNSGKTNFPVFTGPQNERQEAVADAFKHAWKGYKKFAWGHDQLKPQSHSYSDWFDAGLTIVDSLDTAILMGLKQEVVEATEWIRNELSFDKDRYVNLFEVTIRVLGGLLSGYHLTGDRIFIEKAVDLGDRLTGSFTHSKTAIPLSDINLKTRNARGPSWSGESSLSEVATLQLEFRDLSRLTGNSTFETFAWKVSEHIHSIGCAKHDGLCGMFLNTNTGLFKESTTITFGARSDSYYEYLLKQWIQTGKSINWLIEDYKQAMKAMDEKLARKSYPSNFTFVGELLGGDTFSPKMDHLVCFLSGTLGLGHLNGMPDRHMEIAQGLAEACNAMYNTPTGLAPEIAYFNMVPGSSTDLSIKPLDAHCLLRPEAIEAWFYMYRLTGDKKYQEWGWNAFKAIEKYAKLDYGYSSVNSVKKIPVTYRDLMESFYLAETLKYLYLLFDDNNELIPLNKYVFNTEGHPLPIYTH